MRDVVTTILEVAGFATVTVGVFLVAVPAGLMVAGLSLLLVGWLAGRGDGS